MANRPSVLWAPNPAQGKCYRSGAELWTQCLPWSCLGGPGQLCHPVPSCWNSCTQVEVTGDGGSDTMQRFVVEDMHKNSPHLWLKWTLSKTRRIHLLDIQGLKKLWGETYPKLLTSQSLSCDNTHSFRARVHRHWSLRTHWGNTVNSQIWGVSSLPDLQNAMCQRHCVGTTSSQQCWGQTPETRLWDSTLLRKKLSSTAIAFSENRKVEQGTLYNCRGLSAQFCFPWIVCLQLVASWWFRFSKKTDIAQTAAAAAQALQLCSAIIQQQWHLQEISRSKTDVQLPCSSSLILPPPMN